MTRIRNTAPLLAALIALAVPASASADYHAVIRDCNQDGKLDRQYSHSDLNAARHHLPTDIAEYTDCRAVITAALRAHTSGNGNRNGNGTGGGGGSGSGGGGGGSGAANPAASPPSPAAAASPADVSALKAETAPRGQGPAALRHRGRPDDHARFERREPRRRRREQAPLSLLIAILAIAALCAAGGVAAAWRRWPSVVRAPLRLFRR